MTTILVLNAVSSLLATVGIGGFLVQKNRKVRSKTLLQPIFASARTTRPFPGH